MFGSDCSISWIDELPLEVNKVLKPVWKWTGGKRQLLPEIRKRMDASFNEFDDEIDVYCEPFVGGGAVLFDMLERHVNDVRKWCISDINGELINAYKIVRDEPEELLGRLTDFEDAYINSDDEERKIMYYENRQRFNELIASHSNGIYDGEDALESASRFIFQQKTCFNGLYRTNSKGYVNVPHGKYRNPKISDPETILSASSALSSNSVKIEKKDYLTALTDTIEKANNNAKCLVYIDPPYRPIPGSSSFASYTRLGFTDRNQVALAEYCRKLDAVSAKFVLSNSDPHNGDENDDFFDDLYDGFTIERVFAKRAINSDPNGRGNITELLIHN